MPTYTIEADGDHAELLAALQDALAPGANKPQPVWLDFESSRFFTLPDAQRYYHDHFVADMEACRDTYNAPASVAEGLQDRLRDWEKIDQRWFCYQLVWHSHGESCPRLTVRPLAVDGAIIYLDMLRVCFQ